MEESNYSSVYHLIGELCENLFYEYNPHKPIKITSVRKLKAKSYEILLKKSKHYKANSSEETLNPIRELDIILFGTIIKAQNDQNKLKNCDALREHLDFISNEKYFNSDCYHGSDVLTFLLHLKSQSSDNNKVDQENNLLIPGPFTLYSEFDKNSYYPSRPSETSTNLDYFRGLQTLLDYENPYLPQILFQGELKQLPQINDQYECYKNDTGPKPFSLLSHFNSCKDSEENVRKNMEKIFQPMSSCVSFNLLDNQIHGCHSPVTRYSQVQFDSGSEDQRFSWDWENLGSSSISVHKPFVTETVTSLHLQNVFEEGLGKEFIAKTVTIKNFITDLKLLSVGIQSDCFEHDEYLVFHMMQNITIKDVSTNVVEDYVNDFLECGTSYKRLQVMLMKHNYRLMFDGFIFKALCSSVEEYLVIFRQYVFSYEDTKLLHLYKRLKKMMHQISSLSYILAIHPNCDTNLKPPMGSQFLSYIYNEIIGASRKDFTLLLVYILKRCCHVYFKHLHEWIFFGNLDDSSNELFICNIDHYRPFTKYHYDKAYFVRKEAVPGFFQGFEDAILQCGKYTMLLKTYKPSHPLFDLEYPSLSVCLLFSEIEIMEKQCDEYIEKAKKVCGNPVCVADIFIKKAKRRHDFFKLVSKRAKENYEKWKTEKLETAAIEKAAKRKRLDQITVQLKENKNRKIAEKKERIVSERLFLKEVQDKEDKEIQLENDLIKKRIAYYQELGKEVDKRKVNRAKSPHETDLKITKKDDNVDSTTSSARTEFDSCNDDEENLSIYNDCPSTFVELSPREDHIDIVLLELDEDKCLDKEICLEESKLDETNSNVTSQRNKNRNKIMGSNPNKYFCETVLRVPNVTSLATSTKDRDHKTKIQLTDAEKNKLKVLSEEYGFDCYNVIGRTSTVTDMNSNSVQKLENSSSVPDLTDLQKNRFKMMQTDTFAEFDKEPKLRNLNLDLNTERAKNKRKVLESEFNIITGYDSGATPMSTTSDTGPTFEEDHLKRTQDVKNANLVTDLIKIQVDNLDLSEMNLNIPTANIDETPEDCLNTAGVLAKRGFDFPVAETESIGSCLSKIDIVAKNVHESNVNEPNVECDPYKRCAELLNSNFTCKPIFSYFEFKDMNSTKDSEIVVEQRVSKILNCGNKFNSLNELTLTEFLQKSVLTPLNAHLKIMNNEVMRVFLEDLDIIGHLRSLRNFFFLMDGEFGCIICDRLISKLEKSGATPAELLNYQTLHSILDTAIASSIMGNDKNADNLSFIVNDLPETFDLNSPSALETVSLSYRVTWPLNLILNPETLEQYGNIFKYLIKVRRISWLLEEAFNMLKEIVKRNGKNMLISPQYRRIQQIRHKFYHFVHSLKNHITSNALQASWKTFKDELVGAKSMEDVYRKHTNYIKRILFLCMLNRRSSEFSNTIENIFKVSIRFFRNLKAREWKKKDDEIYFKHSRYEKLLVDEADFEKLIKYTIYLGKKIVKHGYQPEIGEFISLINYNQYYVIDEMTN